MTARECYKIKSLVMYEAIYQKPEKMNESECVLTTLYFKFAPINSIKAYNYKKKILFLVHKFRVMYVKRN